MSQQHQSKRIRLGISQGWYQSYLPQKYEYLANFSLYFKLYIFIRFYLRRMNMDLLSFELRTDNTGILILYLNTQCRLLERLTLKQRKKNHLLSFKINRAFWGCIGIKSFRWGALYGLKPVSTKTKVIKLLAKYGYIKSASKRKSYTFTRFATKTLILRALFFEYYRQKRLSSTIFRLKKHQKWFQVKFNKFYYNFYKNNIVKFVSLDKDIPKFTKNFNKYTYKYKTKIKSLLTIKRKIHRNKFKKHFKFSSKLIKIWGKWLKPETVNKINHKLILRSNFTTNKFLIRITKQKKIKHYSYKSSNKLFPHYFPKSLKKKTNEMLESIAFNKNYSNTLKGKNLFRPNYFEKKELQKKQRHKHWRKIMLRYHRYKKFSNKFLKFYRFEQILSKFFRKIFGYIFIVKFIQILHKIIATKVAMFRMGFKNFNLLYRYRKLRYFSRHVRLSLNVSRHSELFQITSILKSILWYWRKKHMYSIRGIKELIRATRSEHVKAFKFVVKGKVNARSRAKAFCVNSFGIPWNQFNSRIDCSKTYVNAKTGTFTISLYTYSGIIKRRSGN